MCMDNNEQNNKYRYHWEIYMSKLENINLMKDYQVR